MNSLLTKIKTWLGRSTYKKYHKTGKATAIGLWLLGVDKVEAYADRSPHPLFEERLKLYTEGLATAPAPQVIAFGDSLKDIPRDSFTHLPPAYNFSISGSRAHHMQRMAEAIQPVLQRLGKYDSVEFVHVGTLEGNGFLMGSPLDHAVARATECLDAIRRLFPKPRIIVDLLPPTYSPYANLSRAPYEAAMLAWVARDGNACSVGFHDMGLLAPNLTLSSDGVHFTPEGVRRFDEAMEKARRRSPGTLVEA